MSLPEPLEPRIALAAATWFIQLQSPAATAAERAACERWRARHPQHELAWQRAVATSARLGGIPRELGLRTLAPPRPDRRAAARRLAVLALAAPAAWALWRATPAGAPADFRTAAGETRRYTLADGSRLALDTASAADLVIDDRQRLLRLRRGAALVETAPDARPFIAATAEGTVQALGTRFLLRREAAATRVVVLEHAVAVRPGGGAPLRVAAGQSLRFTATAAGAPEQAPPQADAWTRGVLYADDLRLDEFLAELGRYRPGLLRCDPAVAHLRVSGAFLLADTDAALASLTGLLPVRIQRRSRWWVSLEAAPAPLT